jgi:hypothetical protein
MISDSAALLMFAIRSSIKLGQQARQSFVDSTRRRELFLPLPNFFAGTNEFDAKQYFEEPTLGKRFVDGFLLEGKKIEGSARLKEFLGRFQTLNGDEKRELIDLHVKYQNIESAERDGGKLKTDDLVTGEELYALFTIQQWRRGTDPTPSTLHRMAGTLVEIGIDYALTDPNLFDRNSSRGKALLGFLTGLQNVNFVEGDPTELPVRLFVAAVETISAHAELVSGDPRIQELVQVTTQALSADVNNRTRQIEQDDHLDPIAKREARLAMGDWAELIFRSTLASGGRLVLSHPDRFLGVTRPGQQALIASVGQSVLSLCLDNPGGIRNLISRDGVETIIKTALGVLGDHPELLEATGHEGVQRLLSGLAKEFSQIDGLLSRDMLPEVARLVLQKSAENLELFWPERANNPERNLLLTAAKTTLALLSEKPPAGAAWKLQFSQSQLLSLTETVLDEFVVSPGWLLDQTGQWRGTLEQFLKSVLGVLREPADNRLSPALAADLMREALRAVVLRKGFLDQLPAGRLAIAGVIGAVLDAVLDKDLDPSAAWQVVRDESIRGLTQVALSVLAQYPLNDAAIQSLAVVLGKQVATLADGKSLDLESFEKSLNRKLKPSTSDPV